ncbi:TPA: hypothetical protein NPN03_005292 [Klebsiella pneumoniae]|nr:hypothetical protein [Klebsiella pneumoniae]
MSTSTIEALASAWARIAEEAEFPADYEGTATPQAALLQIVGGDKLIIPFC